MKRAASFAVRRPPMPVGPWPDGRCRWCGEDGVKKPSLSWHKACVPLYRIACFSSDQRHAVWDRDQGKCAACLHVSPRRVFQGFAADCQGVASAWNGRKMEYYPYTSLREVYVTTWHADHIKPLWSAPRDMPLDDRAAWFGVENLQTLCPPCHARKTADEAAQRAVVKSGQGRLFRERAA